MKISITMRVVFMSILLEDSLAAMLFELSVGDMTKTATSIGFVKTNGQTCGVNKATSTLKLVKLALILGRSVAYLISTYRLSNFFND